MAKVYKNPGPLKFTAILQQGSQPNSWGYLEFPYDLKETFGVGNLVPFKATFDGRVIYRGSLAKMGGPKAMVLLRKDIRMAINKAPGDRVEVVVELDDKLRKVVLPSDARTALSKAGQLELFEGMAYSHRKEYVRWIEEAKKPETRTNRIQKMTEMLAKKPVSPKEQ
jgi:hypothetical protein